MPDGSITATRPQESVAAAALAGLTASPKTLPSKLFYDEEGCRLFGAITALPEYYPTRTELKLLGEIAGDVASLVPPAASLVEYGGSDESKAAILLRALRWPASYVPIDVAGPALAAIRRRMELSHPEFAVVPVEADFLAPLRLPPDVPTARRVGFFPGSTVGNLEPAVARRFLAEAKRTLGARAQFLVGVDLRKSPDVLVPAYDDAAGVTAAFNRNILHHLNRAAGADFDPEAFDHRAIWNDAEGRIEMHLVSRRAQSATVGGRVIRFARGETIHTENSYKHTEAEFAALAAAAGWHRQRLWTDADRLFSIHLLGDRVP
ncbi:MAG TPA: L-histidine N(alpha)-methyltransferase [Acetobacteraceae bacterium]|nr:L-histidine N(alpha)-methyltransferase [Acetobacteraceae bacterium]